MTFWIVSQLLINIITFLKRFFFYYDEIIFLLFLLKWGPFKKNYKFRQVVPIRHDFIQKSSQLGTTSVMSYWSLPTWHDFCPVILKSCQLGTTSTLSLHSPHHQISYTYNFLPSPSGTFSTPPNIFGTSAFTPLSNPTSSMHYRPTMLSPASHNEANDNDDEHVVDDPLPRRPRRQIRRPHCVMSSHK